MSLTASYTSINPKKSKKSFAKYFWKFINGITIEPILISYILSTSISALTHQNLILEKACRVNLNFSHNVCDSLTTRDIKGFNESHEVSIQQIVAEAYVWKNAIASLLPTILLISLGSWSDRNRRRKILILLPSIGHALSNIGLLISTFLFYEISMEMNVLIDVLPSSITGSTGLLLAGIFSYISEHTPDEKKTWKIGVIHIMMSVSSTIGIALSGILYHLIGFYGVFLVSTILYVFATIYGLYFVKERVDQDYKNNDFKDIFNIKKTLKTYKFIKWKEDCEKMKQLLLLLFLAVLNIGPAMGERSVFYLYTRYMFHWNEVDFSIFNTYYCIAHFIGSAFALSFFSKYLKIDDALLGAFSVLSRIFGGIVYTLAQNVVQFYAATLVEVFSNIAFVASRSIMSKIIPTSEIGKANSLFAIAESLTILLYGPIYSALYKATLGVFSGSFFVLGVICSVPAVISYLWIYFNQTKMKANEKLDADEGNKDNLLTVNEVNKDY